MRIHTYEHNFKNSCARIYSKISISDIKRRLPSEEDMRKVRDAPGATLRMETELPQHRHSAEELRGVHEGGHIHNQLPGNSVTGRWCLGDESGLTLVGMWSRSEVCQKVGAARPFAQSFALFKIIPLPEGWFRRARELSRGGVSTLDACRVHY